MKEGTKEGRSDNYKDEHCRVCMDCSHLLFVPVHFSFELLIGCLLWLQIFVIFYIMYRFLHKTFSKITYLLFEMMDAMHSDGLLPEKNAFSYRNAYAIYGTSTAAT